MTVAAGEALSPEAAFRAWVAADAATVSGRGLEALVIGATLGVPRSTWILPGRRERGCAILRGCPPERLDQSRPYRVVPPGNAPAQRALQGVGLAMTGDASLVFLGSGSVSYGAFHEALQLAAARSLPVTFVVSWWVNEGPFAAQLAVPPARLAEAVGLAATVVDATDEAAVRAAVGAGVGLVQAELRGRG